MKFTGKLVDHFDNLDVDTMSMFEVVSMVERLGFVVTVNVFWQLSDNPLEVKKLISDGDVLEMVRNVPRDHYLHIYIVEVEPDSNLEDEDCDVEPETRIESDSNSKEVEPETRIESDSNSEDEEYEVEDESSTDQSKFSDSENELASSEDEIFNVNVGLGSDEVEVETPVNGEDPVTGSWQISLEDLDLEPPQQVRLKQLRLQVQLQQNLHNPMFLDGCPPYSAYESGEFC
ncbi:hypothetical protein V6N12_056866 [Hibiscus sabdariffa]|uniref:PB1-like domain-containing protein n=1 Tax=Hibiscus sabdariffa TaxID=183260 RepID=A0ABR2DCB8_9ROSI